MRNAALLQNAMRLQAQAAAASSRAEPRIGLVSGYDPNRYAVKVTLQPEGNETGWIPLGAVWVGNGWGLFAPPSLGDQVEVSFLEGSSEAGCALLRFFNDVDQPLAVPSGELWIVHKKGGLFKLLNTGAVTFSDGQGATFTLNGDGTITSAATQWTHTGPVHFTDNVQVDKTLTATTDVVGGGKSLKTHTHPDPQGGNTGPPN